MKCPALGIRRFSLAILIFFASIAFTPHAMASGDVGGCSPVWRLLHRNYDGCSNMAFLSPSNDTRANILLLLADLRSAKPRVTVRTTKPFPDAPLFEWDDLASSFAPQADKATLSTGDTGAQNDHAPCPATLPSDDPFVLAVQADHALQREERDILLAARRKNQNECTGDVAITSAQKTAMSAAGKAYAQYLEGAAKFWQGDSDAAAATFSSLTNAQPAWVRETATYMIGRTLLKRAQAGAFDEYGSFVAIWHADASIITAAEAALDKYLQQYPQGAYTKSARGLKRRGYWLAQDTGKLEQEYSALLLMSPEQRNVSDVELLQEIDNKLITRNNTVGDQRDSAAETVLLESTHNPLLLAMLDLLAMRSPEEGTPGSGSNRTHSTAISITTLEQQKPYFAGQMPLYEYLLAVHAFYIENKPAEVLRLIPDAARQSSFSYVQFSRQILRGMALEAFKDHNALAFWLQMLPGAKAPNERPALELAVAYHEERAGEIRNVFAPESPVHYPYLRQVLLAKVADADLLRAQAKNVIAPRRERDIALFTLLYKEATRGQAEAFLKDLALVPANAPVTGFYMLDGEGYTYYGANVPQLPPPIPLGIFLHDKTGAQFPCPGLRASEAQLVKDPGNPAARLCVADFVRLNPSTTYSASAPPSDELGDTPSLFPDGDFVRMETYTAVLANEKSTRNDKAYALFRAVNCYGPSGNNACGGKDVPVAQRKAWFLSLKHDYAGTRWANALQYYW